MALCNNCGNKIDSNTDFCNNCGMKIKKTAGQLGVASVQGGNTKKPSGNTPTEDDFSTSPDNTVPKRARRGMEITAVVFYVLTVIMFFSVTLEEGDAFAPLTFLVLGAMFNCLAFSPKSTPYMFGKSKGIKKYIFVLICVGVAFTMITLSPDYSPSETARVLLTDNMII